MRIRRPTRICMSGRKCRYLCKIGVFNLKKVLMFLGSLDLIQLARRLRSLLCCLWTIRTSWRNWWRNSMLHFYQKMTPSPLPRPKTCLIWTRSSMKAWERCRFWPSVCEGGCCDDEKVTVTGLARYTEQTSIISGYEIPPGVSFTSSNLKTVWSLQTIVAPAIGQLMKDPNIWPDPNQFIPERWLEAYKGVEADKKAFHPFSAGSRNCPGQQ